MSASQIISVAAAVGGIALIILGLNAVDSFSSDISRFFTGNPTDKSLWMLIGGSILLAFGVLGALLKR
jgi:hypothetical protein